MRMHVTLQCRGISCQKAACLCCVCKHHSEPQAVPDHGLRLQCLCIEMPTAIMNQAAISWKPCSRINVNTCHTKYAWVALTPTDVEEPAMAGSSHTVKDSFGNLLAKMVVPTAEAVLETSASFKACLQNLQQPHAVRPSLLMIPSATTLSGHAAAQRPSPLMCQPVTLMPQTSVTCTKSVSPNAAAVLQAFVQSRVWQQQQQQHLHQQSACLQPALLPHQGQQCAELVIQASPDAISRSSHWLQLQHQQLQQQPGEPNTCTSGYDSKLQQVML